MKIETRITRGKLKGYTIRKAKSGWYALYFPNGVSLTEKKHTLEEIKGVIKEMSK